MKSTPEDFSSFYSDAILAFDVLFVEKAYAQFRPYFKGKSCLELGPATGYMTRLLIDDFEKVTVVEGSESLIAQIPNHVKLVKHFALFEEFEPGEQFDTIIVNHVLEHIEHPVELLLRIKRWLKPAGSLIVGVPNSQSFHRLAAVKMGLLKTEDELNTRDIALGHHRVYDLKLLKEHVLAAGYTITDEGGVFLKFLSNHQIEQQLNRNIIDAYFELGKEFKENSAEIYLILTL
ncbi:MAG: class I SAM-dependent methyltransferase [Bacteroidota bacterium]